KTLPPALSVPLLEVAGRLELPPVATYAGLVLWNYTNTKSNGFRPESLQVRYTFTGTSDEAWFYLISVAIEAEGRHVVQLVFSAMDNLETKDFLEAEDALAQIGKIIGKMNDILGRIHERCKPDVFYHRIRPFLRGSRGIPSLPRGVFYD
ncbi:indoleamine-dioxygenase, partial [Colletotrichum incanum]